MGSETRFFERQLDRTAYGACIWLAVIVIGLVSISTWLLWQAGTWMRHQNISGHFHIPTFHTSIPDPQAAADQAKQAAAQKLEDAAKEAASQAANQAVQTTQQQAQSAAQNAQQQASQNLNQFLK